MLRSTAPALYGASHLFSILQLALYQALNRIRLNPLLHSILHDWEELAVTAHQHPVSLHTLAPMCPTTIGATDTSKHGMGSFWFHTTHNPPSPPCVWRSPFPLDIQQRLLTHANPNGQLSKSNLELLVVICGAALAAQRAPTPLNTFIATDNTPALSWLTKGSTTTKKAPAFLLHLLARLRHDTPFNLTTLFTPGSSNTLADCCSHLFHLTDDQFLDYINTNIPVQPSWTLVTPPTSLCCKLNSALYSRLQQLASPPKGNVLDTACGTYGKTSVHPYHVAPSCTTY